MRTTKADFGLFKQNCEEFIKKFGLVEWSVHYAHEHTPEAYASTAWRLSSATATITLGTVWDDLRLKTEEEIKKVAFHEVLHLVLSPLIGEANDRFSTQIAIDIAEHTIIRRLENTVL